MLPVNWLYVDSYAGSESGRTKLVKALARAPHESLFSTDLVITLVESFWEEFSSTMIYFAFLPFMVYLAATVVYFGKYINEEPQEMELKSFETWFRVFFYILWAYFTFHEIV